jgi:putative hydrolase of the HAD superfamily
VGGNLGGRGFRKPAPEFFDFALVKCALSKDEVLFVGNQLNTDVTGGEQYGIRTVWLSGRPYRSADEILSPKDVRPAYRIRTLRHLPLLLQRIHESQRSFVKIPSEGRNASDR